MLQYTLNDFFNDISNKRFNVLRLDLNKNGHVVAALQSQLRTNVEGDDDSFYYDDRQLDDMVESNNFYSGKWRRFNIMIASLLKYCQDIDPWSSWNSCDVIFQFYSDLNNCILNDTYPVDELIDIFIENTEYIIPLAEYLDANYRYLQVKRFQFLSYTSSIISKTFNSIKSQHIVSNVTSQDQNIRTDQLAQVQKLSKKQTILLYLVNKLNNIYFKIHSPQLCSNIFRNFKPKSSVKSFTEYPVWQQIEYRYLLGRFYLLNNRVSNSFVQLNKSFTLLFESYRIMGVIDHPISKRNLQRILRYLVPVGLIMGKLPNLSLVSKIMTDELNYGQLIEYVRSGNICKMNQWIKSNEIILRKRHLLLILLEKLSIITYRYLLRRVIKIWSIEQQLNRLPYEVFERCLKLSINDSNETGDSTTTTTIFNGIHRSENVENILVTLINLGYLRGNCFPLLRLCVFQRTRNINDILPPIENTMLTMFPLNSEDSWLDN